MKAKEPLDANKMWYVLRRWRDKDEGKRATSKTDNAMPEEMFSKGSLSKGSGLEQETWLSSPNYFTHFVLARIPPTAEYTTQSLFPRIAAQTATIVQGEYSEVHSS